MFVGCKSRQQPPWRTRRQTNQDCASQLDAEQSSPWIVHYSHRWIRFWFGLSVEGVATPRETCLFAGQEVGRLAVAMKMGEVVQRSWRGSETAGS